MKTLNQEREGELEKEIKITPEILKDWPDIVEKIEARKFRDELLESRSEELEKIRKIEYMSGPYTMA